MRSRTRGKGLLITLCGALVLAGCSTAPAPAGDSHQSATTSADYAVGPQYDTTHVYVQPGKIDSFINSWIAVFGGTKTSQEVADVTPTPSETKTQLVFSPVGTLSVFDFQTPIPYPFGSERTGLLVRSLDGAVQAARESGAQVTVAPFPDPVGRDAVVQFPGGVNTQLYWHTKAPTQAPLASMPENRVYLTSDSVDGFLSAYLKFTGGKIVTDNRTASAAEIGMPGDFRRIQVESQFGNALVLVTDGHLPYPFGREVTGYAVKDVAATVSKANMAGAKVVWGPVTTASRKSAMIEFPGGYIAEIHTGN